MQRFIVDAMLGKLARWLRLAGKDTIYIADIADDKLLEIAISEDRIILTSDAELYNRAINKGVEAMLVRGGVEKEVAEVFKRFKIPTLIDPNQSRCSKCNGQLEHITREEKDRVKGLVHDQTYSFYDEYWLCKECKSVFFQGGQWRNIMDYMKRISEMMEK